MVEMNERSVQKERTHIFRNSPEAERDRERNSIYSFLWAHGNLLSKAKTISIQRDLEGKQVVDYTLLANQSISSSSSSSFSACQYICE